MDTSAWYAFLVPTDQSHAAAAAWMAGNAGQLVTTDYVLDETLTLLRSHGERVRALTFGDMMFGPNAVALVHYLTPAEIAAAWGVFSRFADKDWSFTDCTSKVVIDALGVPQAFSFDRHFRQFGTVAVVP